MELQNNGASRDPEPGRRAQRATRRRHVRARTLPRRHRHRRDQGRHDLQAGASSSSIGAPVSDTGRDQQPRRRWRRRSRSQQAAKLHADRQPPEVQGLPTACRRGRDLDQGDCRAAGTTPRRSRRDELRNFAASVCGGDRRRRHAAGGRLQRLRAGRPDRRPDQPTAGSTRSARFNTLRLLVRVQRHVRPARPRDRERHARRPR